MRHIVTAFASFLLLVTASSALHAQNNAPKKTIAVDQFLAAESTGGAVTGDGLTALLIDALIQDGRFVVVERTGLASVQAEQSLGASGASTAETAPKGGQLIGANVIVRGTVTKYAADAGGGTIGISGLPLGDWFSPGANVKHKTSTIEISLRLIDATTAQVIATYNAKGSASATGAGAGIVSNNTGLGISADAFRATPIGQAAQDAIVKAVALIAAGMQNVPWSSSIVDVSGNKVYVSGGTDRNITTGMVLTAYRKGKVLTDPSTNQVLDVELTRVGSVRVDGAREKISTAVQVDGTMLNRGDILKFN
jgi:curli biogenesis system outer membrane secretion channel CsgG